VGIFSISPVVVDYSVTITAGVVVDALQVVSGHILIPLAVVVRGAFLGRSAGAY
jgi:hypothetical protein